MKKITLILALSLNYLMLNAQTGALKKFSFLVGHWEMKTKSGKTTEHWKAGTKTYLGSSYKHDAKGDSTLTETVVIEQAHGSWYYRVTGYEKSNPGTTNFRLISAKKNRLIFENPEHDFPQRIVYEQQENDRLLAWIEGKINGKEKKIEFPYTRKINR